MKRYLFIILVPIVFFWPISKLHAQVNFTGTELLARPTDHSITVNVVADAAMQAYFEYGTTSGVYPGQTGTISAAANDPIQAVMSGLSANTRYYYRMVYSTDGGSIWVNRSEHSFYTQRPAGSTFKFDVLSDSHINIMLGTPAVSQAVMTNIANSGADYLIDLGDTFMMDNVTSVSGARSAYMLQRSSTYMGKFSHSIPIFLAPGNHEEEEGWHLDDTGNPATSKPILGTNARKRYYPNPVPDAFYTGNMDTYSAIDGDQLHEDYYAWSWGDALFVVIDPFWYTTTKPFTGDMGGGETSDTGSGDRWDWTLGLTQYNWLRQTLQNSSAKYKFVLAHHMTGGSDDYVRKGAYGAPYCEWGGYNENGTTYAFDTRRSGWYAPVHQVLVENHVSAFFHGHDHQYAYETLDGVVYQSCASGGFTGNGFGLYSESNAHTIRVLPSAGHLVVTVTPTQATVDYIGSSTGTSNYYYTILPNVSTTYDLTMAVNPAGSGTTNPAVGVHTYAENSVVEITATPAAGFVFDHWTGDVADVNSASTTVTMDANQAVTAHFTEINYYNLTMAVDPSGSGTTNPAVGVHSYAENQVVTITATPATGYIFDYWTGDVVNPNSASTTVTMDANQTVTTHFVATSSGILGDVNGDAAVNSTDALIVLSGDVGIDVSQFCPMNCGDVNDDGSVNSTDALIILSYDVGMSVPFSVGQPGCPGSVTPCAGCNP